jgi:hypothetical protein
MSPLKTWSDEWWQQFLKFGTIHIPNRFSCSHKWTKTFSFNSQTCWGGNTSLLTTFISNCTIEGLKMCKDPISVDLSFRWMRILLNRFRTRCMKTLSTQTIVLKFAASTNKLPERFKIKWTTDLWCSGHKTECMPSKLKISTGSLITIQISCYLTGKKACRAWMDNTPQIT